MKQKIGVALGGGAARGWAHIGILNALAEMGIKPDIIAGTSIGSLVGASYANSQEKELETWVRSLTWKEIVGFLDLSMAPGGLIQGDKLIDFFASQMPEKNIEALPITYAAVATELRTGEEVWIREGRVLDAVRASISLPGLFKPEKHNGKWLVDGGLVNPVPVSLCRDMGADIVIAVNLNSEIIGKRRKLYNSKKEVEPAADDNLWDRISDFVKDKLDERKKKMLLHLFGDTQDSPDSYEVLSNSINIVQDRITRSRLKEDPPDVLLEPKLPHIGLMDFDRAEEAIEVGRQCVEKASSQLQKIR
ncbi:MAG TPA: patatin-like phospholipase RssA [Mariprofundaceae bacterium]|nr:patatin-like phospholipase RssA [Mariprofundaceae bacterium]